MSLSLASRLPCRHLEPPLGPTGSGNSPTGSGRPVRVYTDGTPLAVPGESVKVTVRADIHSENTWFATRPEPEVARPKTKIVPVAGPSFGDIAIVSSSNQSVESGSEVDVETLSAIHFRPDRNRKSLQSISTQTPVFH